MTKGQGDYLNLRDYPWSINAGAPRAGACQGPGPEGTLVIDDATGQILGASVGSDEVLAAIAKCAGTPPTR